jgi:formate dehydrogenase maturation protein FdhE
MRMSFACLSEHELPHPAVEHSVRVHLERGQCPVCPGHELDGVASGGLEWAHCQCCGSDWRLETDGFALRPGRIVEEWA